MRVVVTGQVGLDKKTLLKAVGEIAARAGRPLTLCNVGDMMYAEAPDVKPGRILDLPLGRLTSIRRSVFKDILHLADKGGDLVINTHATFRWRHGLFYGFDYDQMKALEADLYIAVVDNIDRIHYRLSRDHDADHTLKDLMVWREEEVMATELLGQIVRGHGCFYIMPRGVDEGAAQSLAALLLRPELRKAYLSFPITHVLRSPRLMAEIDQFRREMKRLFVCFDPGDVEEKYLAPMAIDAARAGHRAVRFGPAGEKAVMDTQQLLAILPDIDGQIYARDFKLIDQADMIISLIPALDGGGPALSSGVERELQHAHESAKDVFVIWHPEAEPSPFITETATRVFRSLDEAVTFFQQEGFVPGPPRGSLFA
jgi:adenylate kinase